MGFTKDDAWALRLMIQHHGWPSFMFQIREIMLEQSHTTKSDDKRKNMRACCGLLDGMHLFFNDCGTFDYREHADLVPEERHKMMRIESNQPEQINIYRKVGDRYEFRNETHSLSTITVAISCDVTKSQLLHHGGEDKVMELHAEELWGANNLIGYAETEDLRYYVDDDWNVDELNLMISAPTSVTRVVLAMENRKIKSLTEYMALAKWKTHKTVRQILEQYGWHMRRTIEGIGLQWRDYLTFTGTNLFRPIGKETNV